MSCKPVGLHTPLVRRNKFVPNFYAGFKNQFLEMTHSTDTVTRGSGLLEKFLAKKRAAMANKLIPRESRMGRILDVGCGTTPFFLLHTQFNEKFGIDPSVGLSYAAEKIVLVHFDVEEETIFPFEDNFFDVVTLLAVFEHIEKNKIAGVMKEIKRVLKPGGVFIMTTPCPGTHPLLWLMARLRLVSGEELEEHKDAYGPRDIAFYLAEGGFEKEKMKFGYFELFLNNWATAVK